MIYMEYNPYSYIKYNYIAIISSHTKYISDVYIIYIYIYIYKYIYT